MSFAGCDGPEMPPSRWVNDVLAERIVQTRVTLIIRHPFYMTSYYRSRKAGW